MSDLRYREGTAAALFGQGEWAVPPLCSLQGCPKASPLLAAPKGDLWGKS